MRIVYCPSYWSIQDAGIGIKHNKNAEFESVNSLCIAKAFENGIALVFSNAGGKHNMSGYFGTLIGQSQITMPFKGVIKKMDHNEDGMFVAAIDTEILIDAEKHYKTRKDLKFRLV